MRIKNNLLEDEKYILDQGGKTSLVSEMEFMSKIFVTEKE
jgi:hypothetical protein